MDEVACQATVTATQEGCSSSEREGPCLHMSPALGLTVIHREAPGVGSEEWRREQSWRAKDGML